MKSFYTEHFGSIKLTRLPAATDTISNYRLGGELRDWPIASRHIDKFEINKGTS